MEILAAIVLFSLAFGGLALGVILRGRQIQGSCGGGRDADGNELGSCVCKSKDNDLCPSDNDLVRIGQLGHPDPKHHR